ncbi:MULTISPECIES: hypothetical protein [Pasteurellaceae]|uniref:DUF304 domain-containing protein n=1 Tax=Pasteurella atlantica TaxID=2827233 RepID=A0AAW8CSG5_9PAST|nr:hypothetical protein [Pasteurella atlantica]MBR0573730.1 hypothetical protein [Pasteurella atlantica]MDP8039635.1 hypothetical protein [Pasteurella atlantica]MDP8041726.1 hypothetical protein [Pasteurella atlantica]MDP8044000.1 hypothetical protein [Pasteurella atlantica]MDP8045978.1 hypothetical protein [Pasteurella atlantica]
MKKVIQHEINLSKHLLKNGPKFCTHYAIVEDELFYFKPTRESIGYSMLYFVLGGLLFVIASIIYYYTSQLDLFLFITLFGISLIILGFYVSSDYIAKIKFDKKIGVFSKKPYRCVKLENIVGLQINQKQQLSYVCYEMNMLTKGGRRINILNHNGLEQMRKDMQMLADFLALPSSAIKDYSTLSQ